MYNQWLTYDFGQTMPIGRLCIRWDDFKNITYGASSVRVDTSLDGAAWDEGAVTYDESMGMPDPTMDKDDLHNLTLDELCFRRATFRGRVATTPRQGAWRFRGDESRCRRGRGREPSVETSRGDAAGGATRIV